MTTTYLAKLTTAGAAAFVASESGSPVVLAHLAVGDASGTPYTPTGSETALEHEVARVTIESVTPVPGYADRLRITGIIPADDGGFTIREVGVFTDAGDLAVIANFPPTAKAAIADGAPSDLTIGLEIQFTGTPTVTVEVDPSLVYATRQWTWGDESHFAVKSATTTAPPGGPTIGDKYLVPHAGASGAWAGQGDKIAIWAGAPSNWVFIAPAQGAVASAADTPQRLRRTGTGWVELTHGMTAQATVTGSEELAAFDPDTGDEVKITVDQIAAHAAALREGDTFFLGMM